MKSDRDASRRGLRLNLGALWRRGEKASGDAVHHNRDGQFAAVRHQGQVRRTNQDQALATELDGGWVLLAVADGVGGVAGGELASAATMETVIAAVTHQPISNPRHALLGAVAAANGHVREMASIDTNHPNMATTLVAALIDQEGSAWVASVGDSRGYAFNGEKLVQLTEDDSWVAEQIRAGALTESEAEQSPYKNVITRGVGVEATVDVGDVAELSLQAGQGVLLCSDGLYRMVEEGEIAAVLNTHSPAEAADQLVAMANAAGGADNISVAIYKHPGELAEPK